MTRNDWNSRSIGSRFKHGIFYATIRWLGMWPAYALLYVVVFYYSLLPAIQGRSRPYLARRFPGASRLTRWRHGFRLNIAFGMVLLERAAMGLTGRMVFEENDRDNAALAELIAEGRGLVILTAHVGAWQIGMAGLTGGAPVNIVQRRDAGDIDRHYFEHGGGHAAPRIIDAAEPVLGLALTSAALLHGEVVCLMGDRVRRGDSLTLEADFLGGTIRLPGSPFYLAGRHQCPVAVVFTDRRGRSRVTGRIYRILRVPEDAGRDPDRLRPYARAFAEALEEYVREHPYQFFNFYDLWREQEEDAHDGIEGTP